MTLAHALVPTMLRREHRRTVPVDHERRTDIRVAWPRVGRMPTERISTTAQSRHRHHTEPTMPTTRITCLDLDDPFGVRRRPPVDPDEPARTPGAAPSRPVPSR